MGSSSTLSFRVKEQIVDRLEEAASEENTSRSGVAREALLAGLVALEDPDTGEITVPEHVAHDARVQRMIARNKKERRQGKFRSEFSGQLKRSFENNETPAEFRNSVAGYLEEAEDMGDLPEEVREQIDSDATTYREWCEEMIDYYRVAYKAQNWDHDPIDDPLGNHEGIENAREWIQRAEHILDAESSPVNGEGAKTNQGARRKAAQFAIQDGVVPEHIVEDARENYDNPAEGVLDHAREIVEQRGALTDSPASDNPELE